MLCSSTVRTFSKTLFSSAFSLLPSPSYFIAKVPGKLAAARDDAVARGVVLKREMELERATERAALDLVSIYPAYALREFINEDLNTVSVD